MKKYLILLIAAICCSCSVLSPSFSIAPPEPVTGVVIYDGSFGYHIVETKQMYVIVEWFSGPNFSKGDRITGRLLSFGATDVFVNKKEKSTRVYVEDYFASKDSCFKWLKEHGRLK